MTIARQRNWIRYVARSPGIEWAEASFVDRAFSPHRHDTYAVGYTTRGVQTFDYRGETCHALPGDAFVLHPDELHDGRPGTEDGYSYRIMYIAPDLIGQAIGNLSLPFVAQAVIRDRRFTNIVKCAFRVADENPNEFHRTEIVRSLADAICKIAGQPPKTARPVDVVSISNVRDHILDKLVDGISMVELEREHHMDRYSISRQFQRIFGVSPSRFVKMRRLDLAKTDIQSGKELAEAAIAAGFADQSHMTRDFRETFGVTPGLWKSLVKQSATIDHRAVEIETLQRSK